jgi:hypothetical protein
MNRTARYILLTGVICVFAASSIIAQEIQNTNSGMISGLRRRALVLDIDARVLENGSVLIWNETHQKTTMPGSPVNIQLRGANIVVAVQFTPFFRRHGNVLVAQGQVWINDPERGVSYYTLIQTIPMVFDEPIYFFPLGTSNSSIEIVLTVNPLREEAAAAANSDNDE